MSLKTPSMGPRTVDVSPASTSTIYCFPVLTKVEQDYFIARLPATCRVKFNAKGTFQVERQTALQAEIIIGNVPPEWVAQSQVLRFLQLDSVGIDNFAGLDWQHLQPRVTACNLSGFFTEPVAEEVLTAILMLYRCLPSLFHAQLMQRWCCDEVRPQKRTLRGASVVILGCGAIGHRLIELLAPFDCKITAFNKQKMENVGKRGLLAAAAACDVFVSTVAETSQTRGIVDSAVLRAIGKDGLFINVGRGSVVDESELCAVLSSGSLGGAYLDVVCHEPLPPDSPLWKCPRLTLSQHTGGGSRQENMKKIDLFLENIVRFKRGETPRNVINWRRGY